MVDIRFLSLVLGLLFLLNAIRDYSCAHAHQQDWENDKDKLVIPEYKELVDGFATTSTRKLGVGGRKMVAHEVLMRRKFEKEPSAFHGGASKDISGEQYQALVKYLQASEDQNFNLNHQKNVKPKTQKPGSWRSPRSEPVPVHLQNTKASHSHQDSKKLPAKASLESLSRSEKKQLVSSHEPEAPVAKPEGETQRLLEATKEIVNLMDKDYRGMPRRKPPINNHVPIH